MAIIISAFLRTGCQKIFCWWYKQKVLWYGIYIKSSGNKQPKNIHPPGIKEGWKGQRQQGALIQCTERKCILPSSLKSMYTIKESTTDPFNREYQQYNCYSCTPQVSKPKEFFAQQHCENCISSLMLGNSGSVQKQQNSEGNGLPAGLAKMLLKTFGQKIPIYRYKFLSRQLEQ